MAEAQKISSLVTGGQASAGHADPMAAQAQDNADNNQWRIGFRSDG